MRLTYYRKTPYRPRFLHQQPRFLHQQPRFLRQQPRFPHQHLQYHQHPQQPRFHNPVPHPPTRLRTYWQKVLCSPPFGIVRARPISTGPSTPQGQTFIKLVEELFSRMNTASTGFINFPLDVGMDYLQEKYALEMLYRATEGEGWWSQANWMSETDPCEGWHGIGDCRERNEGSCGVLHINLSTCVLCVLFCDVEQDTKGSSSSQPVLLFSALFVRQTPTTCMATSLKNYAACHVWRHSRWQPTA